MFTNKDIYTLKLANVLTETKEDKENYNLVLQFMNDWINPPIPYKSLIDIKYISEMQITSNIHNKKILKKYKSKLQDKIDISDDDSIMIYAERLLDKIGYKLSYKHDDNNNRYYFVKQFNKPIDIKSMFYLY